MGEVWAVKVNIRPGEPKDAEQLESLYNDLNDYLSKTVNYPGWRKGIYPTRTDAETGIQEKCLYVAVSDNRIVGSVILSHEPEQAYYSAEWQKDLDYEKVFVIYTFAVHPDYLKKGIGLRLLEFAEELAGKQGVSSLRLDVTENNIPAIRLYEKFQFRYIGRVDLGLEACGPKWFKLYEKLLNVFPGGQGA